MLLETPLGFVNAKMDVVTNTSTSADYPLFLKDDETETTFTNQNASLKAKSNQVIMKEDKYADFV
jgi:hypothetical protein